MDNVDIKGYVVAEVNIGQEGIVYQSPMSFNQHFHQGEYTTI